MMKKMFKRLMVLACVCALSIPSATAYAAKDEDKEKDVEKQEVTTTILTMDGMLMAEAKEPFIVIDKYELSQRRIVPGEEFTLTLHVRNNSDSYTAYNVLMDIANPEGVAPVYGTVSQKFLGDLEPNESRIVTFDYDSWSGITSASLDFSVVIASHAKTNYITLRVPTGAESIFNVMSVNMPTVLTEGEEGTASVNFKVMGEENISNVVLKMKYNDRLVGSSQAVSIMAGSMKTQSVSFSLPAAGEYMMEFHMDYVAADGHTQTEFLGTKVVEVKEAASIDVNPSLPGTDPVQQEEDNTKTMMLLMSGVLILAIFVVSAIILKKKR